MPKNDSKLLKMPVNGRKLLEMVGKEWKWQKKSGIAGNGVKLLEIAAKI